MTTRRLRAALVRLSGVFRRHRGEDFDAELASHLRLHVDDNLRAGMTPVEARRQAVLALGGIEAVREAHRDRRGIPGLETLARDVRHALRLWRRSPGFTAVAVLSLALGVGANTAIFSLMNGLVLRPLAVRQPDRLVHIVPGANRSVFSNPMWEAVRDRKTLFEDAAAWATISFNLAEGGETRPARGLWVSGGFFKMLGVSPVAGRLLSESDDRRGAAEAVVLSHGFWLREFGGASSAIGSTLHLDGAAFTIIGVAPPDFVGVEVGRTFDVAVPLAAEPRTRVRSALDERSSNWLRTMARLKPGQTIDEAAAALNAARPQIRAEVMPTGLWPSQEAQYLTTPMLLVPAANGVSDMRRTYQQPLTIVLVVAGLVFLMACTNLASLLLAKAEARRHEMSVRLALGASRSRLVRQMLVESMLLAVAGGLIGVVVATSASRLLLSQITTNRAALDLDNDWRVFGFALLAALAAAAICGLAPAWRATRGSPRAALATGGRLTAGPGAIGQVLVAVQVGVSLILVVAAALFVRTLASTAALPLGFEPNALMTIEVDARKSPVPPGDRMAELMRVRERVAAVPGVSAAAYSSMTPLAGGWDSLIASPNGAVLAEADRVVYRNAVSPEYFPVYGLKILQGRGLEPTDARTGAPAALIVNQAFARKYFPDSSPLGRQVGLARNNPNNPQWTIVGVTDDAVYEFLKSAPPPTMYHVIDVRQPVASLPMTVRVASGDPLSLTPAIAAAVSEIDPRLSLSFNSLAERVNNAMARERLLAWLSGFFGALGLLLAALGLFGVVAQGVHRRRREIGVRMALGARAWEIVSTIVGRTALLVLSGLIVGGALGVWASKYVAALLFGVEARDPTTFAGAAALLAVVAVVAAWRPAWRAAHLDPTTVLREG